MQIIYVSGSTSEKVFRTIARIVPGFHNPAQKFNGLVMQGLAANRLNTVQAVSYLSIPRKALTDIARNFKHLHNELENGIRFNYLKAENRNSLNIISDYFRCKKTVAELYKNSSNTVVLCDALRPTTSEAALKACKKHSIPCIAILTDMPTVYIEQKRSLKQMLAGRISRSLLGKYDGYIFLTEQMNELINKGNKPYRIVEGLVDIKMERAENTPASKKSPRVCLYAGGIRKVYGIEEMIKGFLAADVSDAELHIYGSGSFEDAVRRLCDGQTKVKFFGTAPNEKIVAEEITATLLVNPRPAEGEFTKYSFPSKNVEYMVSGTPMLGTRLAGIPEEYFKYMFMLDECSEEGFSKAFASILSTAPEKLHEKGMAARRFVLEEKNNVRMTEKITDLISEVCRMKKIPNKYGRGKSAWKRQ